MGQGHLPETLLYHSNDKSPNILPTLLKDEIHCEAPGHWEIASFWGMLGAMNAKEFNKLVKTGSKAAVVDVWAPWCGPCKRMNPLFEEMKQQYEGQVALIKVNADESQPLVKQLGVLGIPTTIVYRDGEEIGRRTGAMSRSDLERMFEAALSQGPVKIPSMSRNARLARLLITAVLIVMGFSFTPNWLFFIFAAIVFFLAVYDLIPGVTEFRDRMIQKLLRAAVEADVDVRQ